MSFDAAACAAWLGASVSIAGVDTPLPGRLVKLLLVAFGDDMFAEADVPDSDDVLAEDDIKARLLIWNAVIDDVCKSQTSTVLSSEKLRFAAWFRALYQGGPRAYRGATRSHQGACRCLRDPPEGRRARPPPGRRRPSRPTFNNE
eukprot:jgi/Chrpa1/16674/Chrysochromulina_OHIO_Genome00022814-RA